eukprot:2341457-Prymnesium_polylepis.1
MLLIAATSTFDIRSLPSCHTCLWRSGARVRVYFMNDAAESDDLDAQMRALEEIVAKATVSQFFHAPPSSLS